LATEQERDKAQNVFDGLETFVPDNCDIRVTVTTSKGTDHEKSLVLSKEQILQDDMPDEVVDMVMVLDETLREKKESVEVVIQIEPNQ
jgi:hypothetical protein